MRRLAIGKKKRRGSASFAQEGSLVGMARQSHEAREGGAGLRSYGAFSFLGLWSFTVDGDAVGIARDSREAPR